MITTVPTTKEHLKELAALMRNEDRSECWKMHGMDNVTDIYNFLEDVVEHITYTALDENNNVVAVYGVHAYHPELPGVGVIWLLGTDLLDKHLLTLCKMTEGVLKEFSHSFHSVLNMTDKANTKIINWLLWCGFSFTGENVVVGSTQRGWYEFLPFYKRIA